MAAAKMSVAELEDFLGAEFPEAFGNGDTRIERADGETCRVRHRYHSGMLRPGGTAYVSTPNVLNRSRCRVKSPTVLRRPGRVGNQNQVIFLVLGSLARRLHRGNNQPAVRTG